jgi:hypothetical protein
MLFTYGWQSSFDAENLLILLYFLCGWKSFEKKVLTPPFLIISWMHCTLKPRHSLQQ